MAANANSFFYGTGRRKTSIARVRLLAGEGEVVVNGRSLEEHFGNSVDLGIARALLQSDPEGSRAPLRQAGFLTRDPRMKERKKYGLKRARKAPQYTKR